MFVIVIVIVFFFLLKIFRYFKEHGWPSSTIFETPPTSDEERAKLIDTLQVFMLFLILLSFLYIYHD